MSLSLFISSFPFLSLSNVCLEKVNLYEFHVCIAKLVQTKLLMEIKHKRKTFSYLETNCTWNVDKQATKSLQVIMQLILELLVRIKAMCGSLPNKCFANSVLFKTMCCAESRWWKLLNHEILTCVVCCFCSLCALSQSAQQICL